MSQDTITPELILCADDGVFPNSAYPALIFRNAFHGLTPEVIEKKLDDHGWCNSWRNGILDSDHYHSNTHEVLAVYDGRAELLIGGPKLGKKTTIYAGDVLIIPAGVAHHNMGSAGNFKCIGAYPNGAVYDMNYGEAGERPAADEQIRVVPFPHNDPVTGDQDWLRTYWKASVSA